MDHMLRLIVQGGARLDMTDDRGSTPLHVAAMNDLWCRMRVLLSLRFVSSSEVPKLVFFIVLLKISLPRVSFRDRIVCALKELFFRVIFP